MSIARIAAGQKGLVTTEQLLNAGVGRGAIGRRAGRGRLHRVHRGVYLVGHTAMPPFAPELAAVLAYGPAAVASHWSAIKLWALLPRVPDGDADVTVARPEAKSRPGIRAHRTAALPRSHRTRRHGVPVTSAARTLLDFAEHATDRELERAFDEALAQRRTSLPQLRKLIDDSAGRRGVPRLASLQERQGGPTITRSDAEEILLALVRKARLPQPEVNVYVGPHELDLFWRARLLNVEFDGFRWHRYRFERDRVRDAELQAQGIRVMRIPWRPLIEEPEAVLVRIAQALTAGFAPRSAAAR